MQSQIDEPHQTIFQLPEEVVNQIAAGEVVQRPSNAVKELIENSLDAGSTKIDITAKRGGLGMLRIEDNGDGIRSDDLELLCKRFCTSKLKKFEDLQEIGTFGFRGEALASLSMVCRVEVTTKRRNLPTWIATFRESEMKSKETIASGVSMSGTVIKASDMFYSMPQRKAVINKPNDEYRHVVDVMTKYAIKYYSCSFTCRKDIGVPPDLSSSSSTTRILSIQKLYSKALADSLSELTVEGIPSAHCSLNFKADLLVSSLTYFAPKAEIIIFVNGRLVIHDGLVKMIRNTYSHHLPKKVHPFVFVELTIPSSDIDVNAHPTKEKVIFLNEAEVVAEIEKQLSDSLENSLQEKNIHLKRKLSEAEGSFGLTTSKNSISQTSKSQQYAHELIRTDSELPSGAMDRFIKSGNNKTNIKIPSVKLWKQSQSRLSSVQELVSLIESNSHTELRESLSTLSYVGTPTQRYSIVQMGLELHIVDMCVLSAELLFQSSLTQLGKMPRIFTSKIPLRDLITEDQDIIIKCLVLHRELLSSYFSIDIDSDGILTSIPVILSGHSPPLHRFPLFIRRLATVDWQDELRCIVGICEELSDFYMIDSGELIPLNEETDPTYRVSNPVEENQQKEITSSPITHIALPNLDSDSDSDSDGIPDFIKRSKPDSSETDNPPSATIQWTAQHVLFPAVKTFLMPPKNWIKHGVFTKVADLPSMYKIFERC